MNEKLLEIPDFVNQSATEESPAFPPMRGRRVDLPPGLNVDDLAKLTPEEIDAKIKEIGPAIGYAAMVRLAAGYGEVAAGTQYHAAQFLVQQAEHLIDRKEERDGNADLLRALNKQQLKQLIQRLELEARVNPLPAIIEVEQDQPLSN